MSSGGVSLACLVLGAGIALASKSAGPGMELIRGKPAQEAGLAALGQAEKLAGSGTWELIGVARVYYLSGNKAHGQSLIDRVLAGKSDHNDWQLIPKTIPDSLKSAPGISASVSGTRARNCSPRPSPAIRTKARTICAPPRHS
jgi:hypothetical protein